MAKRHCLRIPFLIGQRDDTIIGNSCADNPLWEVPCEPANIGGVDCTPADLGQVDCFPLAFAPDAAVSTDLPEPDVVVISL